MIRALILSPTGELLVRWTALLAVAWLGNALLLRQHARWRLILWRAVLVIGLTLPVASGWRFSLVTIRVAAPLPEATSRASPTPLAPAARSNEATAAARTESSAAVDEPAGTESQTAAATNAKGFPWGKVLAAIWALGFALGAVRLTWFHFRLRRLVRKSDLPGDSLLELGQIVRERLGVRFASIRVSDAVASPFVCGWWRPVIMLPSRLVRGMDEAELCALLGHEMAHLPSNDLFWCVAWRWMKAVLWFHPLAWKIPEAHQLACEQDADRLASGQWESRGKYAQLLAKLVLQVTRLPAVETTLTLNASSQIARRLVYLQRAGAGSWRWMHSVAATALPVVLVAIAFGWSLVEVGAASSDPTAPSFPYAAKPTVFREAALLLQDEAGQPVAGAKLEVYGFRVKGRLHGTAYFWRRQTLGEPPVFTTDENGRARVTYPVDVIPEEKLELSTLTFGVTHPDFVPTQIDFEVERGETAPLKLSHGVQVEVSGYFGEGHESVTELVPLFSPGKGEAREHWEKRPNGKMASQQIAPGVHLLQLMGRLPSGQIVYSESVEVTAELGRSASFDLELKPGIRLEGSLGGDVRRPVTNGRVIISVRPKQIASPRDSQPYIDKYGYLDFWTSYRPLAADGTFVFESIPPGDVEVIACGDGFVSTNGDVRSSSSGIRIPQSFPLSAPLTEIKVATEPTAILIVKARKRDGTPVAGAQISTSPNRFQGFGTTILGFTYVNSEEPFHSAEQLPRPEYSAVTDGNGIAQILNLPGSTDWFSVSHPDLEVSIQSTDFDGDGRDVRVKLIPRRSTSVDVTLQPKGQQFLGEAPAP